MARYQPDKAGPKTLRALFHWAWGQLDRVGVRLGDEGGAAPDPPTTPGHVHDHRNLINVLPDQHHPQIHNLTSHSDVVISGPLDGEALMYDTPAGEWQNKAPRAESWPTGLIDGGELNIGPGVNDIEVLTGSGVIVDSYTNPNQQPVNTPVTWAQINAAITAAPAVAGSIVWFTIDVGGNLQQYATVPSPVVIRDEIFLGSAIYNGTVWGEVSSPTVINSSSHAFDEFVNRVVGPTFIIDGGPEGEVSWTFDPFGELVRVGT